MQKHTRVEVDRIPPCDLCSDGTPAQYDAKTRSGPWGNLCDLHFRREGIGLGLGRGQMLVLSKRAKQQADKEAGELAGRGPAADGSYE